MTKTKKMPMGEAILLALMDARNRISAYDLAQADKIQGLIENQLDDMTPIVTSEPDWIRWRSLLHLRPAYRKTRSRSAPH